MRRLTREEMANWINNMPEGRNAVFARAANNLWIRFKNFEKNAPFALEVDGEIVCVVMITKLARSSYCNLYEIVTKQGEEGNGYARRLYWNVMSYMYDAGVERLKMSCTPTSISWHNGNGIIGWGVDNTGSIRVDIPIKGSREEQLEFRVNFKDHFDELFPPSKSSDALKKENHTFGVKKTEQVESSKAVLGKYYLRELL